VSIPLVVHFSGLCALALKTHPKNGTAANDAASDPDPEPVRLNCMEVGEAKMLLLDSSKAMSGMNGSMADHKPRLTVDLRFTDADVTPDEVILAARDEMSDPYGKEIVELGVWYLDGPCALRTDDPKTPPLKVVWGNRDYSKEVPDGTPGNHESDLSWVAELDKCDVEGKLASGFWNSAVYKDRCTTRIRLSNGRLRAFLSDYDVFDFQDPANGLAKPKTPYAQAFAGALILRVQAADVHTFDLGNGTELAINEPLKGTWDAKVVQISNLPSRPGNDDGKYGQEHFAAYYDLTQDGVDDPNAVARYIPYRRAGGIGVHRPNCVFGQVYEEP
jgi:hypothetical protein